MQISDLRDAAKAADDKFQAELVRQHGTLTGDMRYRPEYDDDRTRAARLSYAKACDEWHRAVYAAAGR